MVKCHRRLRDDPDRKQSISRYCRSLYQGFGETPQDALGELMSRCAGDPREPIVIWPFNRGDAYFSQDQQARLGDLKRRRETLSLEEREELMRLVEASFDATISRTRALPLVKS